MKVHQFMLVGPDAVAPAGDPVRRIAVTASTACLLAALVVAVFPGWVMTRF